ncbi:signal peptidase II [Acholeplasma morum]|uniref:signal peptidase II n=1 Tax=Paracholeplasma morum TaxID=264637 RepID=UPI0019565001|nr:signal peptidase II [Paracholeplasma morum]MBM7453619.1 signal peptidase II [Paracholeplasma morum]
MIYGGLIILITIILDQLSKWMIVSFLKDGTITVIDNFFEIIQAHNYGAGWSMFEGQYTFLYAITAVSLIFFGYLFKSAEMSKKKWVYTVGVSLMIGGTIGNFIDRISQGYVVDFLQFIFGSYYFPTFNVADMALTVGVVLFAIDLLFLEHKR